MIKLPFTIKKNIGKGDYDKWQKYYNKSIGERECFKEEGLWRRSQRKVNKDHSGWVDYKDKRRRIVHYEHEFGVVKEADKYNFVLKKTYLWFSLCLPSQELDKYYSGIMRGIEDGRKWLKNSKKDGLYMCGDLFLKIKIKRNYNEDLKLKIFFPKNYRVLDITIYSRGYYKDKKFTSKPWLVLKSGIREKDIREKPFITKDSSIILKYLPAQVELGGGASIEAGVYPLHFLHKIYSVCDEKKKFVFDYDKDYVIKDIITNPDDSIKKFGLMHKKIISAKPNYFYKTLRYLYNRGFIVGPIITNNFDGLIRQVGLKELYVRKYNDNVFPKIDFHKNARSLIVVGTHADRRHIQRSARKRGLKVIYIDPEGYENKDGSFTACLLESPQDEDIIVNEKASVAFRKLRKNI